LTTRILLAAALVLVLSPAASLAVDADSEPVEAAAPAPCETEVLLGDADDLRAQYRELATKLRSAEGDERTVLALQARKRLLEFMRVVNKLVAAVKKERADGVEDARVLERTRTLLWDIDRRLPGFIDELEDVLAKLRSQVGQEGADVRTLTAEIAAHEEILDEVVRFALSHIQHLEDLGLDAERARTAIGERLATRADDLAGRLLLARQRVEKAEAEHEVGQDAASEVALRDAREALDRLASSLWTTCDLMEDLELSTAQCRKDLIQSTGQISTDVFDWEVLAGLADDGLEAAGRWVDRRGPTFLVQLSIFVGIVLAFWLLGRLAQRSMNRFLSRSTTNVSELARRMLVRTVSRVVLGIGFFVALSQVGVNVTALLAGLGIAGFIIGFALQETLGNFAAGAMILMYRPFDVGDVIEAGGVHGQVDNMNLVSTTFLTFDNQTLVVPNSKIWGDVIRNVTHQKIRRVDLTFYFAHGTELGPAEDILIALCREHPAVIEDPPPDVRVQRITQTAMVVMARPWVKTEDYWQTYWELNRAATLKLAEAGIALGTRYPAFDERSGPS